MPIPSQHFYEMLLSIFSAFLASSGFWAFMMSRNKKRDCRDSLLMGLANDRLMYLGSKYIERGEISKEEYDVMQSIYVPYTQMGGNGTAERIMNEVKKLPIHSHAHASLNKGD